jgi:hypothetical protein
MAFIESDDGEPLDCDQRGAMELTGGDRTEIRICRGVRLYGRGGDQARARPDSDV